MAIEGLIAPELLCNMTVADYCNEHNISAGDRQSRIILARHFSELVNGRTQQHQSFWNLTGGETTISAGIGP